MKINSLSVLPLSCLLVLAACASAPTMTPVAPASPTDVVLPTPTQVATTMATRTATTIPTSTDTPSRQVTLEAVGDLMLGRTIGQLVVNQGPQVVFAGVQSALDSADVLVGNLECVLTDSDQAVPKTFNMKAPPETSRALSLAGFDLVSLANNHAMDYGYTGLLDSQKYLGQYGILTVGAGANAAAAHTPVILERNGLRLAFLAYVNVPVEKSGFDTRTWTATATAPGIAWADPQQIKADVQAARLQADVVIVLLHSGIEIADYIPPISQEQRTEAHAAIDAGAVLVLGSHPHVLESFELYHGGLIAYSLGNFVFDQYYGIADATIILKVVLDQQGVQSYTHIPVLIGNGLPYIVPDSQVPAIATRIAPLNP